MYKKNITVFGSLKDSADGQSVKARIFLKEMQKQFGEEAVGSVNTQNKHKLLLLASLPWIILRSLRNSKNIVIFPARNGLRIVAPLLFFLNHIYGRKLHHVVTGGWLPEFLTKRRWLAQILKRFDHLYVQTNTIKRQLEEQGFSNIVFMPNCKDLPIVEENALVYTVDEPFRLCTFSRVTPIKGIEDAVDAVVSVNRSLNRKVLTLDIYGKIDSTQKEWFESLKNKFTDEIKYCGVVKFDESVDVIKKYFVLLFPSLYFTGEGMPGTVIDAYASGVPVISSRWMNVEDIVIDNVTGVIYQFTDVEELKKALFEMINNPQKFNAMRVNCLNEAKKYRPQEVFSILTDNL